MKDILRYFFGVCLVDGHDWLWIPPTEEEAKADEEAYRNWFDNYPIEPYPESHGYYRCSVCDKVKGTSGSAGRPSGYHPGWG